MVVLRTTTPSKAHSAERSRPPVSGAAGTHLAFLSLNRLLTVAKIIDTIDTADRSSRSKPFAAIVCRVVGREGTPEERYSVLGE